MMFSGCTKQNIKKFEQEEFLFQEEAVPVDVPLSLGAKNITKKTFPNDIFQLSYTVKDSPFRVSSFYKDEMERMGWRLRGDFLTDESVFFFEKPHASCIVSIKTISDEQLRVTLKLSREQEKVE